MKTKFFALALSLAVIGGLFAGGVSLFNNAPRTLADEQNDIMIVALRGTADAVPATLPDYGDGRGALGALCFPGLDLVNVATGEIIGTAEDCLAEVGPGLNGGLVLTGTTFFNVDGEGQLVGRGRTTVQEINETDTTITHITGSIPVAGSDSVVDGSGNFRDTSATIRLSGAVDMTAFAGAGTPITFDCLFEIVFIDDDGSSDD